MATYKLAQTQEERIAALRLVYQAYVRAGLIKPNHCQLRVTPYHLFPHTKIFLAVENGEVVHTMSIIHDSPQGVPAEAIYKHEIELLRRLNRSFAEVSCLAGTAISLEVLMGLCRFVFCYGLYSKLDHFVIAVHPRHARFYERIWGFRQFGPQRLYPCVENHPAVALELDFHQAKLRLPPRTQRFVSESPFTAGDYNIPPISPEDLAELSQYVDHSWQPITLGLANTGEAGQDAILIPA